MEEPKKNEHDKKDFISEIDIERILVVNKNESDNPDGTSDSVEHDIKSPPIKSVEIKAKNIFDSLTETHQAMHDQKRCKTEIDNDFIGK